MERMVTLFDFSKPTFTKHFSIFSGLSRPGVALEVDIQRHDVVEPVRRQVQHISGPGDDLVGLSRGESVEFLVVRLRPINFAVSGRRMAFRQQVQVPALLRMVQKLQCQAFIMATTNGWFVLIQAKREPGWL